MSEEKTIRQPETTNPAVSIPAGDVPSQPRAWTAFQKFAFRVGFIYIVLLIVPPGVFSIPPDFSWFRLWIDTDWTSLHYRDLYDIARFNPSFPWLTQWLGIPRLAGHAIWVTLLAIASAGALIWTLIDRKARDYNTLYYWALVMARYRAGIGIIGFGFTKLLPVQMPYPSEGLLNTDFGDFSGQKIYWMSIGIVPWYQVFAGIVEVLAGTLLFFRQTTVFGAALLFGALGSITWVNHAYDGGVQGYAFYFVLLGLYIFGYYAPRIHRLFILQQYTVPVDYWPTFPKRWQKRLRYGLKAFVIFLFLGVLFYLQLLDFLYDPYKQPSTPGVKALRGYYDVSEFRVNGEEIPYSPLDTVRWQEAIFEKWTTLAYKVNKPTRLSLSNGGGNPIMDLERNFEITGTAGGRRVFHYYADTTTQTLYLQDKVPVGGDSDERGVPASTARQAAVTSGLSAGDWIDETAWEHIGDERTKIHPRGINTRRNRGFAKGPRPLTRHKMVLHYEETADGQQVVLTGTNEHRDSLYIVLDRVERNYLLSGSSLEAGQYD